MSEECLVVASYKENLLFCCEGEQLAVGEFEECFRDLAELGYARDGFLDVDGNYEFARFTSVGVFATPSAVLVVFPKNHPGISGLKECDSDSDPRIEDARLLVSVLRKYGKSVSFKLLNGAFVDDAGIADHSVSLACEILEDYSSHGLLEMRENESSNHPGGRVDWPRTIKTKTPVISSKGVFYLEPVVRRQSVRVDDPITLIHKYVVSECFRNWGWLFGYDENSIVSSLPFGYEKALRYLDTVLATTFVSREIRTIGLLRQYLLKQSPFGRSTQSQVLATKFFSVVWEDACKVLFGDQFRELQKFVPQPVWKDSNYNPIPDRLQPHQRPDLLIVRDDKFYVLDAKYYAVPAKWPGWPDIVKQLFYGTTLVRSLQMMQKKSTSKQIIERSGLDDFLCCNVGLIVNAFLFPGSHDGIRCIGHVELPEDPTMGKIVSFSVGTRLALRAYLGYPMKTESTQLFSFIDRQVFDVYKSAIPINLEVPSNTNLRDREP